MSRGAGRGFGAVGLDGVGPAPAVALSFVALLVTFLVLFRLGRRLFGRLRGGVPGGGLTVAGGAVDAQVGFRIVVDVGRLEHVELEVL